MIFAICCAFPKILSPLSSIPFGVPSLPYENKIKTVSSFFVFVKYITQLSHIKPNSF